MKECIWFRVDEDNINEFNSLNNIDTKDIDVYKYISQIPENSLVFGRYSVLPFYKDIDIELQTIKNSKLVNSYKEHLYISNMLWYDNIKNYTPKTFFNTGWLNAPEFKNGWIVKGLTNSRKHQWNTHMYANTKEGLKNTISKLLDDPLIKEQGIVIREYIPLETYEIGINGMRFTNEWRFFVYKNKIIDYGYYWSIIDDKTKIKDIDKKAIDLVNEVSNIVSEYVNFFVVDVAKTEKGNWIVIELNDAQMSGLSTINPETFYKNLIKFLTLKGE